MTDFGLKGKRVLVTGATGFVGGRLAERLVLQCGAEVRALVRNFANASRLGRFDLEMMAGDLTRRQDVERAAEGCDVIFNCAYGNDGDPAVQRAVNVDATGYLIDAAKSAGARRLVHLSTLAVYGATPDGPLDESAPHFPGDDPYAVTKDQGEALALRAAREDGVPVTVLQPTIVYGPFAPGWTLRILGDMQAGRVILVNGGEGLCNPVYVDDLVTAMLLASERDEANGEVFLVSGPEPVTWKEYYGAYEEIIGEESTYAMTLEDSIALFEKEYGQKGLLRESIGIVQGSPELRNKIKSTPEVQTLMRIGRSLVPKSLRKGLQRRLRGAPRVSPPPPDPERVAIALKRPVQLMGPAALEMHAAKTAVSIEKAKRLLGYAPAFDFAAGMRRTAEWARWAGYGRGERG